MENLFDPMNSRAPVPILLDEKSSNSRSGLNTEAAAAVARVHTDTYRLCCALIHQQLVQSLFSKYGTCARKTSITVLRCACEGQRLLTCFIVLFARKSCCSLLFVLPTNAKQDSKQLTLATENRTASSGHGYAATFQPFLLLLASSRCKSAAPSNRFAAERLPLYIVRSAFEAADAAAMLCPFLASRLTLLFESFQGAKGDVSIVFCFGGEAQNWSPWRRPQQ